MTKTTDGLPNTYLSLAAENTVSPSVSMADTCTQVIQQRLSSSAVSRAEFLRGQCGAGLLPTPGSRVHWKTSSLSSPVQSGVAITTIS